MHKLEMQRSARLELIREWPDNPDALVSIAEPYVIGRERKHVKGGKNGPNHAMANQIIWSKKLKTLRCEQIRSKTA